MGLGIVPNVQVIAPSRGPSSIWTPLLLLLSSSDVKYLTLPSHPPATKPHYDLCSSCPGIYDFQSALERVQLMKYVSLPSPNSSIIQTHSLSLSAVIQAPWVQSKAGTGGNGLNWVFFNEGPTGTASGKTPRPVESKTAAVLKCKNGHTTTLQSPLWQATLADSCKPIRKLEQTAASVWVEHKAHYCSTSVFETSATPPEKQTTTKDTIHPTFTSKNALS